MIDFFNKILELLRTLTQNKEKETMIMNCEKENPEYRKLIIKVERVEKANKYTIGKLYVDGEYVCDTLEDTDRGLDEKMSLETIKDKKVYGATAIPTGTYYIELNQPSIKYSNFEKYPWAEKYNGYLPRLLEVKGYEGVLIHVGNKCEDTEGCLLVGKNTAKGKVTSSVSCFNKLMDEYLLPNQKKDIIIEIC